MKTKPFLFAAGASTVVQGLIVLVTSAISYLAVTEALDGFSMPTPQTSPLIFGLGGLSCISCIAFPVIYLLTGFFYTFLHQRQSTLALEIGALGGGLSAGTAGLLAGIFSGLISVVLTPLTYQNIVPNQMPPGMEFPFQSFNTLISSLGSLFSACWSALVAGGLGAIGGLIGGAIFGQQTRP